MVKLSSTVGVQPPAEEKRTCSRLYFLEDCKPRGLRCAQTNSCVTSILQGN